MATSIETLTHGLDARGWGQLFRIALVPLGHLTDRLPLGNPGKAGVSAFESMLVSPDILQLISDARNT